MVHRILIVEDEAIIAEEIATRLMAMGYRVAGIGGSGEAAIALADQYQPDLILMDIMLQGRLDGVAAAKHIYQVWSIPVVYLTAYGDENTLQRAKFAGVFGYLLKPFKERDLRATLEIALTHHPIEPRLSKSLPNSPADVSIISKDLGSTPYLSLFSHELRNPIAHIKLWTQLLQRNADSWPLSKQQEALAQIQTATDRMGQLLDDFLALGRSSAADPQLQAAPLDFIGFCEKLWQAHQFMAGDRCHLSLQVKDVPLRVGIDEAILGYIFNNLLSNAVKYSFTGGDVQIELFIQDRQVGCRISDRGIGISEQDLPMLFTPFYRGSNVGTIPGTGLGLVIAKRCIERCGGNLAITSQLGRGTTVTVLLPAFLEPPTVLS
jgi:light-regulated signal transduction histidine kinase (bacteriophytochrome)